MKTNSEYASSFPYKLRLALVNYSLQPSNIILQMKTLQLINMVKETLIISLTISLLFVNYSLQSINVKLILVNLACHRSTVELTC